MAKCVWVLGLLFAVLAANGQKRWTGIAGNGSWIDPLNWQDGILPGPDDDVALDNLYVPFSYIVRLPDFAVKVRTLSLNAIGVNTITLELPISNTISSPSSSLVERGFTTIGPGYSLSIGKGGVFVNASGSGSGYSLRINDSIRILNGGKYVHRTRTGHAEIVQQLSRAGGTGSGVFRFENTDGSSIISISGRVFGTLELSAAGSASGVTSYMAAGINKVSIRGDFIVEPGVNFSLNFSDTITISGHVKLTNAIVNLANGNRSSCLWLEGNLYQQGGTIFESSQLQMTGSLVAGGSDAQVINCTGRLEDSVVLVINNDSGVEFGSTIDLPYQLHLKKGRVVAPAGRHVIIGRNAVIRVDSSDDASYIDGKVTKLGLQSSDFLFPVGKSGRLRWMSLHGITGDISVEYFRESAYTVGGVIGQGLDHISATEFWKVEGVGASSFLSELSFGNSASGGVSDLATLRVAAFNGAQWMDAGNDLTYGNVNRGSVRSTALGGMSLNPLFLTIASSSALANLLPVLLDRQWMTESGGQWFHNWKKSDVLNIKTFSLEYAKDGISYESIAILPVTRDQTHYKQALPGAYKSGFCRIRICYVNGYCEIAPELKFGRNESGDDLELRHVPGDRWLTIRADRNQDMIYRISDCMGATIEQQRIRVSAGLHRYPLRLLHVRQGIYFLSLFDFKGQRKILPLVF
ncbi:hypothetical protein [Flavihumibacter solisilvae]|uniref:G8 domain-containing protein n=1 Tax=Flavihumibacter solisilvae TaxID=1349421 RepID=A0A0C1L120_9BACT|nr:hypothetical protein [Flavihumibacter solisilvae]KIC93306.1 hypothetical protein OI18_18860 [Flavihumibacter solisilvae]